MPIQLSCKGCGRTLKAPDSAAGRRAKCPDCGTIVTIPSEVYDAEEVAVAEEVVAAREEGDAFYGVAESPPKQEDPDRTPCAMCGEMIPAGAAKCRYCGEIFDPVLRRIAHKGRKQTGGTGSVCSTLSIIFGCIAFVLCPPIFGLAGLILGIVGVSNSKNKAPGTVGIVLSILGTVVGMMIGFFIWGRRF